MDLRRLPLAALLGAAAVLVSLAGLVARPAEAADPKGAAMPTIEIESDVETGEARPAAPDQRLKHLYLGIHGGVTGVAGSVAANTPSLSVASTGFTYGGFLGIGVSRYATFQVFGDGSLFAGPGVCTTKCAGSAFSVGMGMTYHLAQALAFDPWGSFGVAYRQAVFTADPTDPAGAARHYQGIDWARIAFGGDFYPTPFFGFGPFIEGDFGTNFRIPKLLMPLPPDVDSGPTTYAMFQIGVRVAFDPLRSGSASPAKKTGRRPLFPSIGLASPTFGGAAPGF